MLFLQQPPPAQEIQFDIHNPVDYTVANNHDAVYQLIIKYGMPAPQTPAETLEAAHIAVDRFGDAFAHDMALIHPDLQSLLDETGHSGSGCSKTAEPETRNQKPETGTQPAWKEYVPMFMMAGLFTLAIISISRSK